MCKFYISALVGIIIEYLVGCTIEIYYDVRPYERHKYVSRSLSVSYGFSQVVTKPLVQNFLAENPHCIILWLYSFPLPIPVATRSKEWVCGRSFAGIEGSNPAVDMDVCLL